MGAARFTTISLGRDAADAFYSAVRSAEAENMVCDCDEDEMDYCSCGGYDTYSGTIASKSSVATFPLPKGLTAERCHNLMWKAVAAWDPDPECKPSAESRKAWKALTDKLGEQAARNLMSTADDKWGSAVALEVTGAKATEYRRAYGRAGSRVRVFILTGHAPE